MIAYLKNVFLCVAITLTEELRYFKMSLKNSLFSHTTLVVNTISHSGFFTVPSRPGFFVRQLPFVVRR